MFRRMLVAILFVAMPTASLAVALPVTQKVALPFQLRTIHDRRVRIGFVYPITVGGLRGCQVEFKTPYGVFQGVEYQRPSRPGPILSAHSAASKALVERTSSLDGGVSRSGAVWELSQTDRQFLLHMEFPTSVLDITLPARPPASLLRQLVDEVY